MAIELQAEYIWGLSRRIVMEIESDTIQIYQSDIFLLILEGFLLDNMSYRVFLSFLLHMINRICLNSNPKIISKADPVVISDKVPFVRLVDEVYDDILLIIL